MGHAERHRSQYREYAWKIPFGEYPELAAKGIKDTGSENYGGPIVTAGGLVFIGATDYDDKFRAFDKKTGKLVWETVLPFAGNGTPGDLEIDGRQYIVIAASGMGNHGQRMGGLRSKAGGVSRSPSHPEDVDGLVCKPSDSGAIAAGARLASSPIAEAQQSTARVVPGGG